LQLIYWYKSKLYSAFLRAYFIHTWGMECLFFKAINSKSQFFLPFTKESFNCWLFTVNLEQWMKFIVQDNENDRKEILYNPKRCIAYTWMIYGYFYCWTECRSYISLKKPFLTLCESQNWDIMQLLAKSELKQIQRVGSNLSAIKKYKLFHYSKNIK
jgi:hypothetical protein